MIPIKLIETYHDMYIYEIEFESSTIYATSYTREVEEGELTKEKLNQLKVYENADDFSERYSEYRMGITPNKENGIDERCKKMESRLLKSLEQ